MNVAYSLFICLEECPSYRRILPAQQHFRYRYESHSHKQLMRTFRAGLWLFQHRKAVRLLIPNDMQCRPVLSQLWPKLRNTCFDLIYSTTFFFGFSPGWRWSIFITARLPPSCRFMEKFDGNNLFSFSTFALPNKSLTAVSQERNSNESQTRHASGNHELSPRPPPPPCKMFLFINASSLRHFLQIHKILGVLYS